MLFFRYLVLAISASSFATSKLPTRGSDNTECRYLPGDKCWPRSNQWGQLNTSVCGRLVATVPRGHVCHDPTYNDTACEDLRSELLFPRAHFDDPSDFMSPFFQNATCDPYTPRSEPCLSGNYVEYAINVTNADDVKTGLLFAQENNIRIVIKNTGHDYSGKSTGKGGLGLWMHNLKDIGFFNYTSYGYSGPAVKMGAGVQGSEAFAAADQAGWNVLGGECVTVGLAGGFSQGGGHSLLSSLYGLGADQALEWEVITANGTHVIATPTKNSDLYWALSGGGGGTYAVVLSLTAKAYPNRKIGGARLVLQTASNEDDALWNAVTVFQRDTLPKVVDRGAHVQWAVLGPVFAITEASIPDATEDDMREILQPFTDYLRNSSIPYQLNITSSPTFYAHADKYLGPLPYGLIPAAQIVGGVMISRTMSANNTTDLVSALRHFSTKYSTWYFSSYALDASKPPTSQNAVLPAWRDMLNYILVTYNWNYTAPLSSERDQKRILTEEIMPLLRNFSSGAYLNEADFDSPTWREDFYGSNWDRLLEIKQKWDPDSLLYAKTAVGSDAWVEAEDGRLCRTGA
ncbi:FAD-binding domain-containing protein [Karstenula rhodostoma CBS 690.94]|uniref:FAD-binding domain-containing protein n=1 Tax=Karstenula rhodostoma CBS 690.94 TaxID=1392251 RepID=A0A9P4UFA9_9PLEO|nr:FAD-binding domain-containing protein [Karstenula rhodostoma CBS 690.94]